MTKQARKYLIQALDAPLYGITKNVPVCAVKHVTARLGPVNKPAPGAFTPPFPAGYWREKSQHSPAELVLHHRIYVAGHR